MSENRQSAMRGTQTTIDLDRPTGLQVLMVWHNMCQIGRTEGRISASGQGIHIRTTHDPLSFSEILLIREQHMDDAMRIHYDQTAPESKPLQILFDTKRKAHADEWLTDPIRLIDRYGALV